MIKVVPYRFYKLDVSILEANTTCSLVVANFTCACHCFGSNALLVFSRCQIYTLTTSRVLLDVALLQLMLRRTHCSQLVMLAVCVSVAILSLGIASVKSEASS